MDTHLKIIESPAMKCLLIKIKTITTNIIKQGTTGRHKCPELNTVWVTTGTAMPGQYDKVHERKVHSTSVLKRKKGV